MKWLTVTKKGGLEGEGNTVTSTHRAFDDIKMVLSLSCNAYCTTQDAISIWESPLWIT